MKSKIWDKLYRLAVLQSVGCLIFSAAHHHATYIRGYNSLGGEVFFLFLPLIVYLIKSVFSDASEIIKLERTEKNDKKKKSA